MSLSKHKSLDVVFNEIIMLRTAFAGSFLVVEGDDDARFWRRQIVASKCDLVIGNGKLRVEELIRRLDENDFRGALGVVDADFDSLENVPTSPNLVRTDDHDLEALLLQSNALDAVLIEYGNKDKIAAFVARERCSVRDALIARGLHFGRLRWLSHRQCLEIPFNKLNRSDFVSRAGWRIDLEGLVIAASKLCNRSPAQLRADLDELPPASPWSLCQGHDLLQILNIGFAGALGNEMIPNIGSALRLAFHTEHLQATTLHRDIRAWESRNPPYRVLPPPPTPTSPS